MTALYLRAVVVHGQHADHMQGVSTLDELPHSVGLDALASLVGRRRLVAGRVGQLIHADDTVLGGGGTLVWLVSQLIGEELK